MTATFRLKPGELDENFFEKLKAMFRDREVELIVHDVESESHYPFDNPAQVRQLEEAMAVARKGDDLVTFENMEELRRYIG